MSRGVLAGRGQRHLSGTQARVLRPLACPEAILLFRRTGAEGVCAVAGCVVHRRGRAKLVNLWHDAGK